MMISTKITLKSCIKTLISEILQISRIRFSPYRSIDIEIIKPQNHIELKSLLFHIKPMLDWTINFRPTLIGLCVNRQFLYSDDAKWHSTNYTTDMSLYTHFIFTHQYNKAIWPFRYKTLWLLSISQIRKGITTDEL